MSYNNNLTMRDLFCNKRMQGALPQLTERELSKSQLSERNIYKKCQDYICSRLNGEISGSKISVEGKTLSQVERITKSCAVFLEQYFGDFSSIARWIKENKKVYISASSLGELKKMELKTFNKTVKEITDNFLYNPDFVGDADDLNSKRKQAIWKKKVGYKAE